MNEKVDKKIYEKKSTMKVSVITVCYNAKQQLTSTMNSVVCQSYSNIEYLIIDGVSDDGTYELACSYKDKYDFIRVVSEPDEGIYDAMNKGVTLCNGDYVVFLNAGDQFADREVISDTVKHIEEYYANGSRCDIIYGDYYDGAKEQNNLVSYGHQVVNSTFMLFSNTICHQAIFSSKKYLVEHPFDLSYRYVADRKWISECIRAGAMFRYMQRTVVVYDRTGMSTEMDNRNDLRKEVDRYIERMYPVRGRLLNMIKKSEKLRTFAREKILRR